MSNERVKKFNTGNFTQETAVLKIKYYNPKILIVQHLPVKETEKKMEINRMRNGYIRDTLTSQDIHEIVKFREKVIETYEGVIYREKIKVSPFRKVFDKLFALGQKLKDEKNEVMQILVKLIMSSLYGEQIRKDSEKKSLANRNIGWWVKMMNERRIIEKNLMEIMLIKRLMTKDWKTMLKG